MIGETLVAEGVLLAAQLEQALEEQRTRGGLLGDILLSLKFVTEEALAKALAKEAGVPYRVGDGPLPDPDAVALVPEPVARQHLIAPLELKGRTLAILQANPFDVIAIDEIQRVTGRHIAVEAATRSQVLRLIERCYGSRGEVDTVVRAALRALDRPAHTEADAPPIITLIELVLNEAIARGATDLHIEPEDRVVRIRHRIDGVLMPGESLPKELHPSLVSRLKVMAGLDIAEQRLPQDGRMTHTSGGRRIDMRIATFPTMHGEKVAIRVLEDEKLVRGLADLGFTNRNYAILCDLLSKSRGIILVTGPTGAGKTTTLYSVLSYLSKREKNIITVEDPVESHLPAVRQTQIRPKAGLTFATAIRSLLRQDPDVIMIGEIRDPETAQLALRAALSGVFLFSTLHTQDSAGAVPRLMDMGLEPYLLASGVVGVIAQRLLRLICADCKEPAQYPPEMLAKVGLHADADLALFRGRGCERCGHTGYLGRTAAFEILVVTPDINALIRQRSDSRLIKSAAVQAGMRTLLDDALSKALFGHTTIEEVLRVVHE